MKTVQVKGMSVYALYLYDDFMEECMFQIKEKKDQTLASIFLYPYQTKLRNVFKNKMIIAVPSSNHKTNERGFHALEKMFNPLGYPMHHVFTKDDIKQSTLNLNQRLEVSKHIHLVNPSIVCGQDVILIDDVCTTGSSLLACYDALRPLVASINIVVIAIYKLK
jgi:competence protein ComFC